MAKADSVHSTPPTNTPNATRRRLLSQVASVAAGGTALALACPANGSQSVPIPVLGRVDALNTSPAPEPRRGLWTQRSSA